MRLNIYPISFSTTCSFGDFPSKSKVIISSEKLTKEGFSYKYGIEDVYDQCVEYFKSKGILQN